MNRQCPTCYSELEVRDATPCIVCGCWYEGDELKEELAKDNFSLYSLEDDTEIILCSSCHLEEVLANQGALLNILNIRYEEAHHRISIMEKAEANLREDKYCTQCHKRWTLLKLLNKYAENS